MDELKALQDESDHTELMKKMRRIDVSDLFSEYNSKVLVSSFMLYKFREIYDIDDELFEMAQNISDAMVTVDFVKLGSLYPAYFQKFTEWRDKDIREMKLHIQNQIEACRDTATSPRDEADRTWNDCVDQSINLMAQKVDQLDELSRTPPKY
jgi:hypothetical protein